MKQLKDYQTLWSLTDKEYIYLLESYYFKGNDRFERILNHKGYCVVIIPDITPYGLYFKNGERISKEEWGKFIDDSRTFPTSL